MRHVGFGPGWFYAVQRANGLWNRASELRENPASGLTGTDTVQLSIPTDAAEEQPIISTEAEPELGCLDCLKWLFFEACFGRSEPPPPPPPVPCPKTQAALFFPEYVKNPKKLDLRALAETLFRQYPKIAENLWERHCLPDKEEWDDSKGWRLVEGPYAARNMARTCLDLLHQNRTWDLEAMEKWFSGDDTNDVSGTNANDESASRVDSGDIEADEEQTPLLVSKNQADDEQRHAG